MTAERDAAPAAVLLVGAGPGQLDLLTLDAEAAIRSAREIVADRSLVPLLEALAADAELRASPWVEGGSPAAHPQVAGRAAGADVASAVAQAHPTASVHHHGSDGSDGSDGSGGSGGSGGSDGSDGSDGSGGSVDEPDEAGAGIGRALAFAPVAWVDDDRPASTDLLAAVSRGSGVVRLYRGDPWFHPAGDAERAALRADGHRFEVVPGVVEELSVLAAVGIPVQVRTLAVTTTFAVHDPHRSSGETEHSTPPGPGRTATARSSGETEHSTPPGPGRTATAGSAERSRRSTSGRTAASGDALAVPVDAAHTLVVRTTDLAATARRLADRAVRSGLALDRPAAAVGTDTGDHHVAEATRATVATLASRVPAEPGVVVVGLVAALDTTLVRATVAGPPPPRSPCETGREQSFDTGRIGELRSDGSATAVHGAGTGSGHRLGAGR